MLNRKTNENFFQIHFTFQDDDDLNILSESTNKITANSSTSASEIGNQGATTSSIWIDEIFKKLSILSTEDKFDYDLEENFSGFSEDHDQESTHLTKFGVVSLNAF